jgi:hypothetical protein
MRYYAIVYRRPFLNHTCFTKYKDTYILRKLEFTNNLASAVYLRRIVVILRVDCIPKLHNFHETYAHIHTTVVTLKSLLTLARIKYEIQQYLKFNF